MSRGPGLEASRPLAATAGPGRLWGWAFLLVVAALAMLGAWWLWHDGSVQRVEAAGVLRVGYALEAPYADLGPRGEVTGESPESARLIAAAAGLPPIEWVHTEFDKLISGLRARRFDVVASGLFITPERSRQVLFSDPSLCVRPGWLVRRDNPLRLGGRYEDMLDQHGFRIAVVQGSVEASRLASRGELLALPDAKSGQLAVLQGLAPALALSWPTVRLLAAEPSGRLLALPAHGDGPAPLAAALSSPGPCAPDADRVAFAFHPEDRALQARWNQAQAAWLGQAAHVQLLNRFGLGAEDLPHPSSATRSD
ncbi:transporter substrate-binding domain-containing protein [Curvibacter sp. RS43]|uniref:transporter substrate-binding domain-containing protein n=1 Tax=Curvibacter microcysteis TaxID=3026419 RepID=UPI00236292D1|nr:transporter substrate-binding domain-containing protein [Curvibacter sp. RS43]MDD0811098.1 transporter substrate-binding domain-containing protein [Curvibacter sp. RS43]